MNEKKQKIISGESKLMERILQVRYTDMEEEKELCRQLLQISEEKRYLYGCAFAYVYLLDSHLALGEYGSCDFYLMKACGLCEAYGFDDLLMLMCNYAGLYYQKVNDDQTALSYFLRGENLAEKLGDISLAAKLYNNIGYAFGYRKDWETSKIYFKAAYEMIEGHLEGENIISAVSYLGNLAEACEYIGDHTGAKQALERCEALGEKSSYSKIRLGCSWCAYYAMIGERERCVEEADKLIESELSSVDDHFFVCDMAEGLCSHMLDIGETQRAERLICIIEKLVYDESLSLQFRIQCLKIRYWEQCEKTDMLEQAYKKYYEIVSQTTDLEDDMLVQSLRSKIIMSQVKQEYEQVKRRNQELLDAGQTDKLTGLYNRRYFNKLISKVVVQEDMKTLGFIMIDVDCFKQYNDYYGHFKGDYALKTVAEVLDSNLVEGIYASRYGGDEFACLCVNLDAEQIEGYVKNIIKALKERAVPHEKHLSSDILTISVGYSNESFGPDQEPEELMNMADSALYIAKKNGRNGYARKTWQGAGSQ